MTESVSVPPLQSLKAGNRFLPAICEGAPYLSRSASSRSMRPLDQIVEHGLLRPVRISTVAIMPGIIRKKKKKKKSGFFRLFRDG